MSSRLVSLAVRGLDGVPDLDIPVRPMTALIGPRGAGKSRLLGSIHWLLTGSQTSVRGELARDGDELVVTAELETSGSRRTISRTATDAVDGSLPSVSFYAARDRVPPDEDPAFGRSDAAMAEHMVETIAEKRLSGVDNEILLIEEPELMLIPHQQRHLYALLRRYAERNQVIYSTRSPALLDAAHYDEIVRLDRTSHGTKVRRTERQILTPEQQLRLMAEFDHERNEMFFAAAVVLVEGETERLSLPPIFRALGADPDALGISIVEVGGKGNLILVARVLAELRIPHLIVHDSDRGRPGARENDYIREHAGRAPVIRLDPDFEAEAGIKRHSEKVFAAWQRFSDAPPERIPSVFKEIVDTAVRLASGGSD